MSEDAIRWRALTAPSNFARYDELVGAGVEPIKAHSLAALEANSGLRPGLRAPVAPTPTRAAPAPARAAAPTPVPANPYASLSTRELLITAQIATAAAAAHKAIAEQAQSRAALPAYEAELDRAFGIQPQGMTIGVRMNGAVQEFGVPVSAGSAAVTPPSASTLSRAESAELDRIMGLDTSKQPTNTGVRMVGNVQQFGV